MSRTAFLQILWLLILLTVALEAGLYFILGERWFGFYGHATTALIILVPLSWIVTSRYRTLGLSPWPVWIFFGLIAIIAAAQIAFWALFFMSGQQGIGLAIGRGIILEYVEPFLLWAALAIAGLGVWLVIRAASRD